MNTEVTATGRRSLAEQLKALIAYRNRPEGPFEPLGTNWTTVPTNDNASPDEIADLRHERKLLITPSATEIMRHVKDGDVERNEAGQIVRIGKLRFSDGTQTEWAYRLQEGSTKVEGYYHRMPVGALLGCREEVDVAKGGPSYSSAELTASNRYFAEMLGTPPARFIKRVRRPKWKLVTRHDAQRWLDEAIANTPVMPAVTYYPPGLPCGSKRISDSFNGMKVAATGQSGAIAWQDISGAIAQREIWEETLAALKAEDVATLETAMTACSFAEVGVAAGQSPAYADKRSGGKRRLLAANDNLSAALKKSAA